MDDDDDEDEASRTVQDQLELAMEYRAWRNVEPKIIKPKHSPINVPFLQCRDARRAKRPKVKPQTKILAQNKQLKLLDRSVLTQREYTNLLSLTPHQHQSTCSKKKKAKNCRRMVAPPCPARLVQLAVPSKRLVFSTWQNYQNSLPPGAIVRFNLILQSGNQALEPSDARYHFKQLDKRQKKKKKKKKVRKKIEASSKWYDVQADYLAGAVCKYVAEQPLFHLNCNQMMLSNQIVKYFYVKKKKRIPKRTTKNSKHKTLFEIADKIAKCLDDVGRFVDAQPLDQKELNLMLTPVSAPESLEDLLVDESESEDEIEDEIKDEIEDQLGRAIISELDEEIKNDGFATIFDFEQGLELGLNLDLDYVRGDGELESSDFDEEFEDDLDRLIKILSNSDDEFLNSAVQVAYLPPGTTYRELLDDLKALRDGFLDVSMDTRNPLELLMHDWAMRNEPQNVDAEIEEHIRVTSALLREYFTMAEPEALPTIVEASREEEEDYDAKLATEKDDVGLDLAVDQIIDDAQNSVIVKMEAEEDREAEEGEEAEGGEEVEEGEGIEEGEEAEESKGADADLQPGSVASQPQKIIKPSHGKLELGGEGNENIEMSNEKSAEDLARALALALRGQVDDDEDSTETSSEGRRRNDEEEENGEEDKGQEEKEEEKVEVKEEEEKEEQEQEQEEEEEEEEESTEMPEDSESTIASSIRQQVMLGEGEEAEQESLEDLTQAIMKKSLDKISARDDDDKFPGPDATGLDDLAEIIRGHSPSAVRDHTPDTICCLSLKIWAVWLLEISTNAHKWTKWITDIIRQVRRYASMIRTSKNRLSKSEWQRFARDTENKIVAWRQYSRHVEALSLEIMQTFRGKKVACCPKCLQDHAIKNVVTAHETLRALTEAINCTSYWHRCLDEVVEETADADLLSVIPSIDDTSVSSSSTLGVIEELCNVPKKVRFNVESSPSESSVYEIEEIECSCQAMFKM